MVKKDKPGFLPKNLNNTSFPYDQISLEHILKASQTDIHIVDKNFNLIFVDSLRRELYGASKGRKCYEYFKVSQKPCKTCGLPHALETKEVVVTEQTVSSEDNRVVQCQTVPFQDEQGTWLTAVFCTDITKHKRLKEKLKFQLKFEKMVSSISNSFVNIDAEKINETINQSLEQIGSFFDVDRSVIYQFSPSWESMDNTHEWYSEGIEPLSHFLKHLPMEAIPWLFPQVQKISPIYIPDVNKLPLEAKVEKKGFLRQGLQSLLILPFSIKTDGRAHGFLGFDSIRKKRAWTEEQIDLLTIVVEIIAGALAMRQLEKERNQAEKALKESEKRYRTIVENTNDALFTHTFDGKITDLNETAHRMLGYKQSELIGANLKTIRSPEEQKHAPQRIKQLLKDGKLIYEGMLMHKNGTPIPVEVSMKVVSYEGDGLIQGFVRDITERKQAEQQIVSYAVELEGLNLKLNAEMNKAKEVHERTFPKELPKVKGLSLAAHYQPAEKLGGDFYDVIQQGKKLIIYLSDVTGHGVDGAILSVFVKHTINGYLFFSTEDQVRPKNILRYLSRQFQQKNLPVEYFICIFLAVLDLETMEFTYTAAGFQDAPMIKLGNGECSNLVSKGLFLTPSFPEELLSLQEKKIRLTPGTTIFFNTDGLTEQYVNGTYYGMRLPTVFYEHSSLPPQEIARIIREDFRKFNGGSLQGNDDITFLILQVDPS